MKVNKPRKLTLKPDKKYPLFTDALDNGHEICNNLGTAFLRMEKVDEAVDYFKKGLELRNDYPLLYQNLGVIYGKDNRE